jgi:RNA polymerase sigma-70 factor (ECF subfamily)
MLGSRADAEDVLQDAYLRWHQTDPTAIRSAEAWLTTAVTRLAIDRLRRVKTERESYVGPWLPEPLSQEEIETPEIAIEAGEDISLAFLALLETLGPEERAAFVLHDVLDDDYADIAEALGKSQAACRQMVHRARERLTARRKRFWVDEATRQRMLERFVEAASSGDRRAVVSLFASDAVMTSDGGGKAVAALRPLVGAERIGWLWFAIARRSQELCAHRSLVRVNGELGLANYYRGRLHSVSTIVTDGERIYAYYTVANPDKLRAFASLAGC